MKAISLMAGLLLIASGSTLPATKLAPAAYSNDLVREEYVMELQRQFNQLVPLFKNTEIRLRFKGISPKLINELRSAFRDAQDKFAQAKAQTPPDMTTMFNLLETWFNSLSNLGDIVGNALPSQGNQFFLAPLPLAAPMPTEQPAAAEPEEEATALANEIAEINDVEEIIETDAAALESAVTPISEEPQTGLPEDIEPSHAQPAEEDFEAAAAADESEPAPAQPTASTPAQPSIPFSRLRKKITPRKKPIVTHTPQQSAPSVIPSARL